MGVGAYTNWFWNLFGHLLLIGIKDINYLMKVSLLHLITQNFNPLDPVQTSRKNFCIISYS